MTEGNYRVHRAISYPEHPESLVVLDVQVAATNETEWLTDICIHGTYNGPSDILLCKDYRIKWIIEGKKVLELGTATLELSAGKSLRQVWMSIITPTGRSDKLTLALNKFHPDGEVIQATISPFKLDGNRMSYEWEGTVEKLSRGA